jgi:hypothetical protein
VARERNNIFAVTADAVDLALDTAGMIGSVVAGVARTVGIGGKETGEHERKEAEDAEKRVATSLRQEAEAAEPRTSKARARTKRAGKSRATKNVKKKTAKRRAV